MHSRNLIARGFALGVLAVFAPRLAAYNLSAERWSGTTVTMQLQLGATNVTLLDGAASWGAAAEDALANWNSVLTNVHFGVVRDSTAPIARANGLNNVFWSQTIYGDAWDSRTLAITLSSYSTKTHFFSEGDVIFNETLSWNSYRGALRTAPGGGTLYDFHRVALHEFGHALGLNHPDDAGQTVAAVMNSRTSNTDALTADDIAGVRAIYDASGAAPASILSFNGSVSYSFLGSSLTLRAASIQNVGNATSNKLRLELWAMPQSFADGLPSGSKNLGTYDFADLLTPGSAYNNVAVNTTYTAPPNGTWHVVMLITEFTGGSGSGYTIRDSLEFSSLIVSGDGTNAPAITTPPVSQTVTVGSPVTLAVVATGTSPTYQWFKDGGLIPGATSATLSIPSVTASDAGNYTVRLTNSRGTVTSAAGTLTVTVPPPPVVVGDPGRLINLSVLTAISAATPNFTVATVLGPTGTPGTRPLLVRAVGPSLAQFSLPTLLGDPKADFYLGSSLLNSNDNWGGTAPLHAAITQTGAFPLLSDISKDAALYSSASASGSYSVVVSGVGGTTGNVIAEIYDGAASTYSASTPRLVNVSVLQNLSPGGLLTLGFTIGGTSPLKVLIRAIGPGLTAVSVPLAAALADPQLTLFSSDNAVLKTNNDWAGDAQVSAAAAQVGAFKVANTASTDAMLLMSLPPGGYTAQATGAGNTGGFVIVEVYEVP